MTTSVRLLDKNQGAQSQGLPIKKDIWSSHPHESVTIMQLAARIEENPGHRLQWFTGDPIDSLGGLTAAQLVALGRGDQVRKFLNNIIYNEHHRMPIY